MLQSLQALDRIIRGDATSPPALRRGDFDIPIWGLCVVIDALGLLYGLCMGVFSMTGGSHSGMQVLATMLKVPALFVLTLLVTLPSLRLQRDGRFTAGVHVNAAAARRRPGGDACRAWHRSDRSSPSSRSRQPATRSWSC